MESETAAAFSSLESARLVLKPGYDSFAHVFPSASSIPSNQMPISHLTHFGFQINCSIPIHRDQFGREMDDLSRNVPIPNNPMYFSSHSQSNSPSDETEDQQAIDERKQRRMLSNRESARRSRLRKQQHLDELRAQVAHLRAENGQILNKFNDASEQYVRIRDENSILRSQALNLNRHLQRLHGAINAQSHGAAMALGIDAGHCSAGRLTSGSGTMIPSVSPSNFKTNCSF